MGLGPIRPAVKVPAIILTSLTIISAVASLLGAIPAAAPIALLVGTIAHAFSGYFAPNLPTPTPPAPPTH